MKLSERWRARRARRRAARLGRSLHELVASLTRAVAALALFAVFGVCASLATGVFGWRDNHMAIDKAVAVRTEARISQCGQDNLQIDRHNKLVDAAEADRQGTAALQAEMDQILASVTKPRPGETADQAAQRQQFAGFVASLKTRVDEAQAAAQSAIAASRVDRRDCTPAAIDKFYSTTTTR